MKDRCQLNQVANSSNFSQSWPKNLIFDNGSFGLGLSESLMILNYLSREVEL